MKFIKHNPLVIFLESLKGKSQAGAGIAIFTRVLIAMIWANSPLNEYYKAFIQTEVAIQVNEFAKLSILFTSILAGILGALVLGLASKQPYQKNRKTLSHHGQEQNIQ